jgi:hypothetical protein
MNNFRDTFSEPDEQGIVCDSRGLTGIPSQHNSYIFLFRDEAEERYSRLLAQSPFFRRPYFLGVVIEDGKLVLQSSGRRVVVEPETWEGLRDALIKIHFEFVPRREERCFT